METIELREETVERLDGLRTEDESYDELVAELINIYEAEELILSAVRSWRNSPPRGGEYLHRVTADSITMFHSGDG
jgi:hypothetical protein